MGIYDHLGVVPIIVLGLLPWILAEDTSKADTYPDIQAYFQGMSFNFHVILSMLSTVSISNCST